MMDGLMREVFRDEHGARIHVGDWVLAFGGEGPYEVTYLGGHPDGGEAGMNIRVKTPMTVPQWTYSKQCHLQPKPATSEEDSNG